MQRSSQISDRVAILAAILWMVIFLAFSSTGLALSVAWSKIFAFLILVGLVVSTLAAEVYVSRHRPPVMHLDPMREPESCKPPASDQCFVSSLSKSEPCLCAEPMRLAPRSFSSPRLSTVSSQPSQLSAPRANKRTERRMHYAVKEPREQVPTKARHRIIFAESDPARVLSDNNSSETTFRCSPDTPVFWKEVASTIVASDVTPMTSPTVPLRKSSEDVTFEDCVHHLENSSARSVAISPSSATDVPLRSRSSDELLREEEVEEIWRTPQGSPQMAHGVLHEMMRPKCATEQKPQRTRGTKDSSARPHGKSVGAKTYDVERGGSSTNKTGRNRFLTRLFRREMK